MTVNRYLFQSPYSNQVQVGRPDPTVKQEETQSSSPSQMTATQAKTPEQWLQNDALEVQTVEPTITSDALLDIYV